LAAPLAAGAAAAKEKEKKIKKGLKEI